MSYTWEESKLSNRKILGLMRDDDLCRRMVCSIVLTAEGWCPAVPLDFPPMRPEDRAEVTRKLVELNRGKFPLDAGRGER